MLIIEDGSNVTGANSFNTDAELVTYAAARGFTLPSTEAARDELQIKAVDFITSNEMEMQGRRVTSDQELPYPRRGVSVHDFIIASDEIPVTLKKAQHEASIAAVGINLLTNETINDILAEKVDVIETRYFKKGSKTSVNLERVYNYLSPLLMDTTRLVRT